MDEAKDSVTSIQVSDHEILSGSADGSVRRYDIRNGQMIADYMGGKFTLRLHWYIFTTYFLRQSDTFHLRV